MPLFLAISYFILGVSLVNSISFALQCESILLRENLNILPTLPYFMSPYLRYNFIDLFHYVVSTHISGVSMCEREKGASGD